MRVLHFYKTYYPDSTGGIETAINQIARGTARLGITTDVLALTPQSVNRTIELDGHRIHRVPRLFQLASNDVSVSVFWRFSELARQADVIHFHFPWPFMDLVHLLSRVQKPTIVTYHSDIIRQKWLLKLYRPVRDLFLGSVNQIVATSPNYLATSSVLRRFSKKVSVIPFGLDKTSYPQPTQERLDYWRSECGEKFFLFIGVLRYYKGLHILLEAARAKDYPLLIVGAGPTELELKRQAVQLGLKNVRFLGWLSDADKVALLTLCYGIVFPSHLRSEAFGISLLEGAMYGKPLISSEIGTGTSFINLNGETGLVVPPSNPSSLGEALRYLWEHPAEAEAMGKRAEERYWKYFTAEQMSAAYSDVYAKLVADFKPKALREAVDCG